VIARFDKRFVFSHACIASACARVPAALSAAPLTNSESFGALPRAAAPVGAFRMTLA
jgi:hypothetical protein